MKKLFSAGFVIAVTVICVMGYLFGKPSGVQLPEYDSITKFQMDSIKMEPERFGRENLEMLRKNMEAAVPLTRLQAMQTEKSDNYFVIIFADSNEKQMIFRFYHSDGKCYMETENGDLYENVAFAEEYLTGDFGWHPAPKGITVGTTIPEERTVRYAIETEYDVRFWLYKQIIENMSEGLLEEDAIVKAKETILRQYRLYQYAKENGYEIPDQKYENIMEERIAEAERQENYSLAEQEYEKQGTTLEETIRKSSAMIWRIEDTVDYMQFCFYDEFREGKDTVDGVEYDSAGDYRNASMNYLVLNVIDTMDVSDFEREIEEAERYYRNYVSGI